MMSLFLLWAVMHALIGIVAISLAGLDGSKEFVNSPWMLVLSYCVSWFLVVMRPLRSRGAHLGMRWFGCEVRPMRGTTLSWKHVLLREAPAAVLFLLGIAFLGYFWAFFDRGARTAFDRMGGTQVRKAPARLAFVNDFRQFRLEAALEQ